MSNSPIASLKKHFQNLIDPLAEYSIEHLLIDIVTITICAVICGANNWVGIKIMVMVVLRFADIGLWAILNICLYGAEQ